MKLSDFCIENFNHSIRDDIAKQNLNFCNAIALSNKKMSVTLNYDFLNYISEFAVLNSKLECDYKSDFSVYYYGCSPKIDSFLIIDAISNLYFSSLQNLNNFLSEHSTEFMLHKSQAKYLPDLAKLILITIASKYGIIIRSNENSPFLLDIEKKFPEIIKTNRKENRIEIHGCPTEELIQYFKPYRFSFINGMWEICENGITLTEIYSNKSNIKLLVGKVFYSGVLIKPINICKCSKDFESFDIKNIKISYERSTFATVCAFDENRINHPLLIESRSSLVQMFSEDESYKRQMYSELVDNNLNENQIIDVINNYLQNSLNVNQIGVSSNIITSEKKVFFGLRGNGNIDDGCLYPSVNGNAEVYDENVDFYNRSVYEDLPSVTTKDKRCDLLGEISREAYGELRLNQKEESWECYGIVISGTAPFSEPYKYTSRRCHFNVLFENDVDISFEDIKEYQKKASEEFETTAFISFIPKCYESRLHHLLVFVGECIKKCLNSKDFIESILLIVITINSIITNSFTFSSISYTISMIFAALILVSNVINISKHLLYKLKDIKHNKVINIYKNMSYKKMSKVVSSSINKAYHPVAYVSLKLHIENKLYRELNKK